MAVDESSTACLRRLEPSAQGETDAETARGNFARCQMRNSPLTCKTASFSQVSEGYSRCQLHIRLRRSPKVPVGAFGPT
jgi:hypothetical protein